VEQRYLEPAIETMPRIKLEYLQEQRLLELLPIVYENAPLTRKIWDEAGVKPSDIRNLDDFRERAPFVTKDEIRKFRDEYNDPLGGMLAVEPDRISTIFSTSGSTGDATMYAHGYDQFHPFWVGQARDLWEIGVRPGDRVLGAGFKIRGSLYHGEQVIGAVPLMVSTGIGAWRTAIEAIREYRPVFTQGLTGLALAELDQLANEVDLLEVFTSFKGAGFAGEPLSARMRRRLKEWGLEIFVWSSTGDTTAAWECREHDGYHAWEDTVLLESLAPTGTEPVADGELGEMVATSLDNPVTPMIRFRSGDLIRKTEKQCACGRTHARFWIAGRDSDETIIQGRSMVPMDVWQALETVPETEAAVFQMVRPGREMDELKLRVGYDSATPSARLDEVRNAVEHAVESAIGVVPVVELFPEAELLQRARGGKLVRVVKE
jgi:phenylacetate-CoA ligase